MRRLLLLIIASTVALLQGCASATRAGADRGLGVHTPENYATVRVFYATDRRNTGAQPVANRYGGERGELEYGAAFVSIPRNHQMGALEEPSIWRLEFRADPEKHVVLLELSAMPAAAYFQEVAARVRKSPRRSAFVFVHGYNVTFEDAARRTAQISYDLGFEGAPVFYSWPSQGDTAKYTFDENNVSWSAANLERFLADFAQRSDAQRIYLIAHSMGTRAMTQAYANLVRSRPELKRRFAEVILAAPDIDADIFRRDVAPALLAGEGKVTLYASSDDVPLQASKVIHGGHPRAGDSRPEILVVPGIESVDATGFGTDFLNHSYFAQNRSILSDIASIVRNGLRAAQRTELESIPSAASPSYWRFRR